MGRKKDSSKGKRKSYRYKNVISAGAFTDSADRDNNSARAFEYVAERRITMKTIRTKLMMMFGNKQGMEMVQVAILVAIAVAVGIIFKSSIVDFVNRIFGNLDAANF